MKKEFQVKSYVKNNYDDQKHIASNHFIMGHKNFKILIFYL